MKSSRSLIIAGAAIITALVYLSATGRKPPFIPEDTVHRIATTQEACLACHAGGKQSPLEPNHPPRVRDISFAITARQV
ncbi:MAG: hypothetical protein OEW15_04155 [Nitrospirota bacterium]|nr:hypothetical protein [Nitrospirota bacterium]